MQQCGRCEEYNPSDAAFCGMCGLALTASSGLAALVDSVVDGPVTPEPAEPRRVTPEPVAVDPVTPEPVDPVTPEPVGSAPLPVDAGTGEMTPPRGFSAPSPEPDPAGREWSEEAASDDTADLGAVTPAGDGVRHGASHEPTAVVPAAPVGAAAPTTTMPTTEPPPGAPPSSDTPFVVAGESQRRSAALLVALVAVAAVVLIGGVVFLIGNRGGDETSTGLVDDDLLPAVSSTTTTTVADTAPTPTLAPTTAPRDNVAVTTAVPVLATDVPAPTSTDVVATSVAPTTELVVTTPAPTTAAPTTAAPTTAAPTTVAPTTAAPTTAAPTTAGPDPSRAAGDLGLDQPILDAACDGRYITFVGSAVGTADYATVVTSLLDAYPGTEYLRTRSCPSLTQRFSDGSDIYAVVFGPFSSQAEACAARDRGPDDAYVRRISTTDPSDHTVSC